MDNQKIVVVLLLITIILSVVSVIVTMGITQGTGRVKIGAEDIANPEDLSDNQVASASLVVDESIAEGS